MAYKVYLPGKIVEDLELCDAQGNVQAILHININADNIHKAFVAAWKNFDNARKTAEAQQDNTGPDAVEQREKAAEQYGAAIVALFVLLFGEDNTDKMLEQYENDHTAMLICVLPFIIDVIVPVINQITERQQTSLQAMYRGKKHKK